MGSCLHVLLSVLVGVVLRGMISLHSYSGQGKSPMFGDYEAQRHWMEITYHLPVDQWYVNGTSNDLMYWGLDYPPLTAYHSWMLGAISHKLNVSWVELSQSRGHESYSHKVFMRNSVLVVDLLIYIPAIVMYFWTHSDQQPGSKSCDSFIACTFLASIYPGLLLIDHGHFQFNCVSLGLTVWAVIGLCRGHDLLGSAAFSLALNYKQMSLYHALPFFAYLLGSCFRRKSLLAGLWKLVKLATVVLLVFAICWLPFLHRKDLALQVLHRIFPFARGLFEDKVANVWCSISTVIKLKQILDSSTLVRVCFGSTLLAATPSFLHLLVRPSLNAFRLALINSSLVFFLFSYQVHEKSILLVALPVCLQLANHPLLCVWFLMISTFSMLPLLIKDGLPIAYLATMIVFYLSADLCLFNSTPVDSASPVTTSERLSHSLNSKSRTMFGISLGGVKYLFWFSMAGMSLLTVCALFVAPPRRLPDLHPVLISVFSCAHFLAFLVAFHWLQFTSDAVDRDAVAGRRCSQESAGGRSQKLKAH